MKVTIENKKGLNKDLKVFIDKKTMSTHMDQRYEEIKGTVNLKGFRPGKVPKEILKRQFGKAVFGEVLDKVIKDTSTKALQENNIKPDEITKFWLHQANARMINLIVSKVIGSNEFDTNLAPLPIQKFGNLASAGSMFAFNLNNDLEKGQKGIICSFGAGYSVCSLLVERV